MWLRSNKFIVNFEHISHLSIVFYFWIWAYICLLGRALKHSIKINIAIAWNGYTNLTVKKINHTIMQKRYFGLAEIYGIHDYILHLSVLHSTTKLLK